MSTQYPNFVGVIHKHIFIGIIYVVSGTIYSTFGELFNKIYLQHVGRLFGETTGRQIRFHSKLKTLEIEVSLATKPLFFVDKFYTHMTLAAKSSFDLHISRNGCDYIFPVSTHFSLPKTIYIKIHQSGRTGRVLCALLAFCYVSRLNCTPTPGSCTEPGVDYLGLPHLFCETNPLIYNRSSVM